jgi:hypothetical protein
MDNLYTGYLDSLLDGFIEALGDAGIIVNGDQEEVAAEVKKRFLAARCPPGESWGTRMLRLKLNSSTKT